MSSLGLGRIITAMVTPFGPDGQVNLEVARDLARHLFDHGSDGIVVCGTTGEGPTVSDDEKRSLLEALVDVAAGSKIVIASTGTYDTGHSIHLTRDAVAGAAPTVCSSSRRTTRSRPPPASSPTSLRSPGPRATCRSSPTTSRNGSY